MAQRELRQTSLQSGGSSSRRFMRRPWCVIGPLLLAAVLVAGCDDGDLKQLSDGGSPTANSPASPTSVSPDLAYREVQLVPGVGDWVREPIDDSVANTLRVVYEDSSGAAVEFHLQDYASSDGLYEVGFVPVYWEDAGAREAYDNGWTCGLVNSRSRCYRLLTDGLIELDCIDSWCTLSPDGLSQLAGRFYEAFSGGSTDGGIAAAEEACAGVDVEAVARELEPWLDGGGLTLNVEDSRAGTDYRCTLTAPPGSFGSGAGETPELAIWRYAYKDDAKMGLSEGCDFGGTTPEDVFASAQSCKEEAEAARSYGYGVQHAPLDGGGGFVESLNDIVYARPGAYWWQVQLYYAPFDAGYSNALVSIAESLPSR